MKMATGQRTKRATRVLMFFAVLAGFAVRAHAQAASHGMQHGFVLTASGAFASHLVATGHHSRQTEITGELSIDDPKESEFYEKRKAMNASGGSYFVFQAQGLDLPSLKAGQILTGHIIESKAGGYEPKNIIVGRAAYKVEEVLLNIENPFFGDQ